MNILCKLFGHASNEDVYSGAEYMKARHAVSVDGIGRHHITLYAKCPRCYTEYRAGQIHGHQIDDARQRSNLTK